MRIGDAVVLSSRDEKFPGHVGIVTNTAILAGREVVRVSIDLGHMQQTVYRYAKDMKSLADVGVEK